MSKSLWILGFWALIMAGCAARQLPPETVPPAAAPSAAVIPSQPLAAVPAPWAALAGQLVSKGLPPDQVRGFFSAPELVYTQLPMETKLRELFGIFYRSDLTKAIQENLYQLGYDVLIDGRSGPGTKKAITAFQKDHNLKADGQGGEVLNAVLTQLVKKGRVRTLAEYRPPAAGQPSRSATYPQFTKPQAISQIKAHYAADKPLFDQMARTYQVPGALAASIMWIETGYGNYFGKNKAAVVLASMAAAADYRLVSPVMGDLATDNEARAFLADQAEKRGAWARDELAALLVYAWRNNLEPLNFPGSIYGAIGYGQFMPSNVEKFAVDGDGDRRIDLFNKPDAIFSIGRFLRDHGWPKAQTEDEKRQVIMRYNRSGTYVNTVLYVARAIDPEFR